MSAFVMVQKVKSFKKYLTCSISRFIPYLICYVKLTLGTTINPRIFDAILILTQESENTPGIFKVCSSHLLPVCSLLTLQFTLLCLLIHDRGMTTSLSFPLFFITAITVVICLSNFSLCPSPSLPLPPSVLISSLNPPVIGCFVVFCL